MKQLRLLLNISAAIAFAVFCVNYVSYLITGRAFDEAAIYQILYGFDAVNFSTFTDQIILSAIGFLICIGIILFFDRFYVVRKLGSLTKAAMSLLFMGYVVTSPVVTQSLPLIMDSPTVNYEPKDPEFNRNYAHVAALPELKKNLVVIYLESFERTFLDQDVFPGLAPNMMALEKTSNHFNEVAGLRSAGWTMGGMVASQCGIILTAPLGSNNAMGRVGKFLPEAKCIGDLLEQQGYWLEFIGGAKKKFAGKDKFFNTHGFHSVRGLDDLVEPDEPTTDWGRYDDNTLADVLARFDTLSAMDRPFALYALTLDTHPNGYVGPSCAGMEYGDGKNTMLNAVHCSDRVVGDFLKALQEHPGADETMIIVLSDHLALRNVADKYLDEGYRTNLFFVLNGKDEPSRVFEKPGTALDVGATILDYLTEGKIQDFGLGTSLRKVSSETLLESAGGIDELEEKIDDWREPLLSFWRLQGQFSDGLVIDNQRQVKIGELVIRYPTAFEIQGDLATNVSIDAAYKGFARSFYDQQTAVLVDSCAGIYQFTALTDSPNGTCYLSTKPDGPLSWGELKTDVTYDETVLFNGPSGSPETLNRMAFFAQTGTFQENFHVVETLASWGAPLKITSAGYNEARTFRALVSLGDSVLEREFGRGVNVVSISKDNQVDLIGTIDLCAGDHDRGKSISDMKENLGARYVVVVLDSAHCSEPAALETVFKGTTLQRWPQIEMRVPYIAVVDNGTATEFVGKSGSLLTIWNSSPTNAN